MNRKKITEVSKYCRNFNVSKNSYNYISNMYIVTNMKISYLQYLNGTFTVCLFENILYLCLGGTSFCEKYFWCDFLKNLSVSCYVVEVIELNLR